MTRQLAIRGGVFLTGLLLFPVTAAWLSTTPAAQNRKTMTNEAEFRQAMKELSNWGRWGKIGRAHV